MCKIQCIRLRRERPSIVHFVTSHCPNKAVTLPVLWVVSLFYLFIYFCAAGPAGSQFVAMSTARIQPGVAEQYSCRVHIVSLSRSLRPCAFPAIAVGSLTSNVFYQLYRTTPQPAPIFSPSHPLSCSHQCRTRRCWQRRHVASCFVFILSFWFWPSRASRTIKDATVR